MEADSVSLFADRVEAMAFYVMGFYVRDPIPNEKEDFLCWYSYKGKIQGNNFSSPNNFPPEIAQTIKDGSFSQIAVVPRPLRKEEDILTESARKEYEKVKKAGYDKYQKVIRAAWAKLKIEDEKVPKVELPQGSEGWLEQKKIEAQQKEALHAQYYRTEASAYKEYHTKIKSKFWGLFSDVENRGELWR